MKLKRSLVISALCVAAVAATKDSEQALTARMDQVVHYFADDGLFSGTLLVARGDQIVFHKAYGYANYEWKIPNTLDTRFRIGSLTKQFTAAGILLLEQRGRLEKGSEVRVEDRLQKYIPDIPPAWEPITLHQLLTHTSGITTYTLRRRAWPNNTPMDAGKLIAFLRDGPLDFPPGTQMRYDNSGYYLLGAIIEKVSGRSYDDFLRENIFAPFGLNGTGYDHSSRAIPHRASGYDRLGPGDVTNAEFMDMSVPYAAGALYSTTADLFKWQQVLYGNELLDSTELTKMTTPALQEYGYGLFINTDHNRKRYWHTGGINGFRSVLEYFPESKVTVACLSNVVGSQTVKITDYLAALAHGDSVDLPKAVPVPESVLSAYAGQYGESSKTAVSIVLDKGRLIFKNGPRWEYLLPESSTKFLNKSNGAELSFARDERNQVTRLLISQNGKETQYPRLVQSAGLAGTWSATLFWIDSTIDSLFTFDVKGDTFSGALRGKAAAKGLNFTDGKIDGNQISFSISRMEKGQTKPQVISAFTGTLEGDQLRLIYRNASKRPPGASRDRGGNVHLLIATRTRG